MILSARSLALLLCASLTHGQDRPPDWQAQVRSYADMRDWGAALLVIDAEMARAPRDLDLKAWRARVLTWAGRLGEAEHAYRDILNVNRGDPDNWAGLATVCLREEKIDEALRAIEIAVRTDPHRSDLHAAYARVLRAAGQHVQARAEFERALRLDPASAEARVGLLSLRAQPRNELRAGLENDSLSYTVPYRGQSANIITRWAPLWSTNLGAGFYQRSGIFADKLVGSATLRAPSFAAITAGGAIAGDNTVIPKSEAFFDFDRGVASHDAKVLKGVELQYGQHWYWYQAARILTFNGAAILYLPREWSLTFTATGARSAFSGTGAEWRPSGSARLGFPLLAWTTARLSGNIFFAAGTENFASSDQIGRFASQTFGGALRFDLSPRMYAGFTYSFQKRTQNRTDSYTGFSYGLRF